MTNTITKMIEAPNADVLIGEVDALLRQDNVFMLEVMFAYSTVSAMMTKYILDNTMSDEEKSCVRQKLAPHKLKLQKMILQFDKHGIATLIKSCATRVTPLYKQDSRWVEYICALRLVVELYIEEPVYPVMLRWLEQCSYSCDVALA